MDRYVDITRVVDFVERTVRHGAPLRTAAKRAERRFGVPRSACATLYVGRELTRSQG